MNSQHLFSVILLSCYLSVSVVCWIQLPKIKIPASQSSLLRSITFASLLTVTPAFIPPHAIAIDVTVSNAETDFQSFLNLLDGGKIEKVTFYGIRPTYLIANLKEDGKSFLVKEGFPAYDDPLSPSGPSQAIAKVQHTPGVTCYQDISDAMILSKTRRITTVDLKPMLSHSSFPEDYAYIKEASRYKVKPVGNDPKRIIP